MRHRKCSIGTRSLVYHTQFQQQNPPEGAVRLQRDGIVVLLADDRLAEIVVLGVGDRTVD
jgi:hypothetical protein